MSEEPRRKLRFFYGWYIVLASFLASLSYSQQLATVLGLFIKPMQDELGWSRTAITGAQSATRFVEGFVAPFIGRFIDRYGQFIHDFWDVAFVHDKRGRQHDMIAVFTIDCAAHWIAH